MKMSGIDFNKVILGSTSFKIWNGLCVSTLSLPALTYQMAPSSTPLLFLAQILLYLKVPEEFEIQNGGKDRSEKPETGRCCMDRLVVNSPIVAQKMMKAITQQGEWS